jgi:hypothetical protein
VEDFFSDLLKLARIIASGKLHLGYNVFRHTAWEIIVFGNFSVGGVAQLWRGNLQQSLRYISYKSLLIAVCVNVWQS